MYGSVSSGPPVNTVLPLSLDDAIRRGLQTNLQTTLVKQDQRIVSGERLEAINYLMPNLTWEAERQRLQINLAAEGFNSKLIHSFPPGFIPPADLNNIPAVVTVNAVIAQADLTQSLFDLQSFELYRAAKEEIKAVDFSYQSSRGQVIQTVADTYLRALATAANVANAKGLLATDAEVLRQATLKHQAGVVAKLDELRARVQYQQQQQVVIAQQNAFEKAKVDLNREIGLPADQPIRVDRQHPVRDPGDHPAGRSAADGLRQSAGISVPEGEIEIRAISKPRRPLRASCPRITFKGNYGVTGTVGSIYHGTFLAEGTLNVPLFQGSRIPRRSRCCGRSHQRCHGAAGQLPSAD